MSEQMLSGVSGNDPHPRREMCTEILEQFFAHRVGTRCRFTEKDKGFIIEMTTSEKVFSWNLLHGGYFRRFSRELSEWRNGDFDAFCRLLRSPEFYVEICSDNIRIYKHRDFVG